MAIQQRRGAKADFDATKMLPGEIAVTTDGSRKVYVAFAPGDAKELASAEEVEEKIQSGIEEIEQKKEEALAQFPNYEDKIKELEIYKANSIISTSSGTVFHETDCVAVPPINIKLFGKSKQDGIPSMEAPIEAVSHGESGSIGGKVLTKNIWNKEYAGDVNNWLKPQGVQYARMPVYVGKGKEVTISFPTPANNLTNLYACITLDNTYISNYKTWIYNTNISNIYVSTVTLKADIEDYIYFHVYDIDKNLVDFMQHIGNELQIEYGNAKTERVEYTEQPFTFQTPNGLRGIPLGQTIPDAIKNSPIHMNGVYWDEVEQQYYIADTKNENGKDVQRIGEYVVDGSNEWHLYNVDYEGFATAILPSNARKKNGFCNQQRVIDEYTSNTLGSKFSNSMWIGVDSVYIYLVYNSFFDVTLEDYGLANFKAHLNENPLKIWTWLDEPIITDTTDQYDVVMNYPNTTVVNDAGAYMEVEYVCDTQKHIEQNYVSKEAYNEHENRIAELEKAIVNS